MAKSHPIFLSVVLGIPISYLYILASQQIYQALNGNMWPMRLIAFTMGILVFSVLTWIHFNQGITLKTLISLLLAIVIVLIQVFWK